MNKLDPTQKKQAQVTHFLAQVFGITSQEFLAFRQPPDRPVTLPTDKVARMAGVMSLKNQPEFHADAPWRLEPDQDLLPITLYIRDANAKSPGYSPWRLDNLLIEQFVDHQSWFKLATLTPPLPPSVNAQGDIGQNFWVHSLHIPIAEIQNLSPGQVVHLRVKFSGSPFPYEKTDTIEKHLEILRASHPLPLGRVSTPAGPRMWFYGDTHYHSAYTNDIKEYGGSIPETRAAGQAVGLDWLVVTDHSTDLDEIDEGYGGQNRWERLKTELSSPHISNDTFRFILGEEITLIGKNDGFVHMLAMGSMEKLIEGAFLPEAGDTFETNLFREAIEALLKQAHGYPPDILKQLFGKVYRFEDILNLLPDDTLTFAAHPYHVAQVPPAKWDAEDLSHPRLTGHEFWNGRSRKKASHTVNPFDKPGWTDPNQLFAHDKTRIQKLFQHAMRKWDPHLQRGVETWEPAADIPSRRPVFIAGSDAHGDFNYHVGMAWDYSKVDMIDDNAIGRVRTMIHIPDHQENNVPPASVILSALRKGACIVTDGPVVAFSIRQDNRVAHLGEVITLDGHGAAEINILAHSTPEFGEVERVEVISYHKAQRGKQPQRLVVMKDHPEVLKLKGTQGYCRVQAVSTAASGEQYCCFTNPIWFRVTDQRIKQLRVSFT